MALSHDPALFHSVISGFIGVCPEPVLEALRRAGPKVDAARLQKTLAEISTLDLGGFKLSFHEEPRKGSEWMEIGMRSRTGRMLRQVRLPSFTSPILGEVTRTRRMLIVHRHKPMP